MVIYDEGKKHTHTYTVHTQLDKKYRADDTLYIILGVKNARQFSEFLSKQYHVRLPTQGVQYLNQ